MTKILTAFTLVALLAGCSAANPKPVEAVPLCCGDCDGNSIVKASEVGKAQAIANGSQPLPICPAADCSSDGSVSQAEVEIVRQNSIQGCSCCGDCNGDRVVSASELGRAQAIMNGTQPLGLCPAADCDGNGVVNASELATITQHNLNGHCPR